MKIRQFLSRSRYNNERGAILVWMTMMSALLLSFLSFAFDGGYFYQHKRRMQTAADSAALAAALEKKRNPDATTTEMQTVGKQDAATNGFTHGSSNVTVDIITPPDTGNYAGQDGYVHVLREPLHSAHVRGRQWIQPNHRSRACGGRPRQLKLHLCVAPTRQSSLRYSQ
jgi:hypothetical protein